MKPLQHLLPCPGFTNPALVMTTDLDGGVARSCLSCGRSDFVRIERIHWHERMNVYSLFSHLVPRTPDYRDRCYSPFDHMGEFIKEISEDFLYPDLDADLRLRQQLY